eukprot:CAMPEP_0185809092 /NCGR_PEP_ID=MMETSP1322-20130828/5994_1 /TAXON_ID=265543 /ORGANISM="Minutocellus polymorphus, Strain RCC2270" /LENGTH=396 /DNA_ID=CAMNT_0028505341 /DNA_START=258 /DNA_END=1448 /DNA_ORIENTATION=+
MDDLAQLMNASASHQEVTENGPPAQPLQFPPPTVGRAHRVTAIVHNPATSEEAQVPNVVYEARSDGAAPVRGYWIGRKLKKAIYGCVRSCTVLRLRPGSTWTGPESGAAGGGAAWEVTPEMAAVKIMDWNLVRDLRGRHMEDPVKEVSAMQYLCTDGGSPNVLGTLDVMSDEQYLYSFMPFCSCGELFGYVERDGRFSEPVARFWFRQLLNGLYHLQKMGVSHRDISLENVLVDQMTKAAIIDLGMCLRVPFGADDGSIVDATKGTLRRLISPQGQCGKPNYISPEVHLNTEPFDGFAIDVWACGIILFIMLVGLPPFEWANRDDPRFRMITKGGLALMLNQWNRPVSNEAGDLLQRMLREDPKERLSLMEVMDHPWVINDDASAPPPQPDDEWRK